MLDCGTGARPLGNELWRARQAAPAHAPARDHTHWDHIQGFPFFAPIFSPATRIDIYGPKGTGRSLPQVMAGQMEYTYFPVELGQIPAQLTYFDLEEGSHGIADARVVAQYLNHPSTALAYRIEADGVRWCTRATTSPTRARSAWGLAPGSITRSSTRAIAATPSSWPAPTS